MVKTAVIYYCYNRLDHTKKSLPKIVSYKKSLPLFIFCDGAKNPPDESVEEVRSYVNELTESLDNCEVILRDRNLGLAPNVIDGVNGIFNIGYDAVMVLEDDCVPKEDFFIFMQKALNFYKPYPNVMHISGFGMPFKKRLSKDSFITPYPCSWGWGTWKENWTQCNFEDTAYYKEILGNDTLVNYFNWSGNSFSNFLDLQLKGEINSWLIRWYAHIFKNKGISVWSTDSKLTNVGFDGSGEHKVRFDIYNQKDRGAKEEFNFEDKTSFDHRVIKEFRRFFMGPKLINKLKTLLYLNTGILFDKVEDISNYYKHEDVSLQKEIKSK